MKKFIIFLVFLLTPLTLPFLLKAIYPMLSFYKEVGSIDGWLGFLGGYVGGIIAIGGVWWQLKESKKNEEENKKNEERNKKLGLIEYLLHTINKNTENKELSKFSYDIQILVSYTSFSNKKNYKPLYEFEENFFNNNIKTIMEFNKNNEYLGSNILDMKDTINEFNHSVQFLSENSYIKCKLLDKFELFLEKNMNEKNIAEIEIIKNLSRIISKYNGYLEKLNEEAKSTKVSHPHNRYICMSQKNIENSIEKCKYFDKDIKDKLENISKKEFMKEDSEVLSKYLNDLLITVIDSLNEKIYEKLLFSDSYHIEEFITFYKKIKEFNTIENNINGKIFDIINDMNNIKENLKNIKF